MEKFTKVSDIPDFPISDTPEEFESYCKEFI